MPGPQMIAKQINVDLADQSYPIVIGRGLWAEFPEKLKNLSHSISKIFIVTDRHVAENHLDHLTKTLDQGNFRYETIILPPGEETKSFTQLEMLVRKLIQCQIDRNALVLAFGGGVVGDLAGFAAAITLRGVKYIQIPTTLLAQVDSSVGGKTAIDIPEGKNLVGAFYQPDLVLMDLSLLETLPIRQIKAGYAEILKYGLIDDPDFFDWLELHGAKMLDGDKEALAFAVERSCRNKARIVGQDEKEHGARALLNLGHTFAHALEVEAGYGDKVLHGEAVSVGLHLAFRLSVELGFCTIAELDRLSGHLAKMAMPLWPHDLNLVINPKAMIEHMQKDKKSKDGHIHFVLARGIGKAFTGATVEMPVLNRFLAEIGAAVT